MKTSLKNISDLIQLRQVVEVGQTDAKEDFLLCIDTCLILAMDNAQYDLNKDRLHTKSEMTRGQLYHMVQSLSESHTGCRLSMDVCERVTGTLHEIGLENLKVS